MRTTSFITLILLLVSLNSWAGRSQGPGIDPRGRTHEGKAFEKPGEFNKVKGAINILPKGGCKTCLTNMLNQGKICKETNKQSLKEGGAFGFAGRSSRNKCDPKDDAINVGGLLNRSDPVLAAALQHEWCHTAQDPVVEKRGNGKWPQRARPDLFESPCCMQEFNMLAAFKKQTTKASKKAKNQADKDKADKLTKDIEKREEELCKYCCKALEEDRAKKVPPAYQGDVNKLDALCKKKKKKKAGQGDGNGDGKPGDGGTPGGGSGDKPGQDKKTAKTKGGSKIVYGSGASYTITSEEPTLFSNAFDDDNNSLTQYSLNRLSIPDRPLSPHFMMLFFADEIPASTSDLLLITAFDEVDETGFIKVLGIDTGQVISDGFEIELLGVRPRDAAYETDLPYVPTTRMYVLDSIGKQILCMVDNNFDGLPETVHATYADATRFPELETTRSFALYGEGDGGDVLLSEDDLRAIDNVSTSADVIGLFDDDGDCVADRAEPMTLPGL